MSYVKLYFFPHTHVICFRMSVGESDKKKILKDFVRGKMYQPFYDGLKEREFYCVEE